MSREFLSTTIQMATGLSTNFIGSFLKFTTVGLSASWRTGAGSGDPVQSWCDRAEASEAESSGTPCPLLYPVPLDANLPDQNSIGNSLLDLPKPLRQDNSTGVLRRALIL